MIRIGEGYDVHRLVEGRLCIIGGVNIPHETGLLGHSDADVLLHAVTDALLGAAGLGDIGRMYPDTDPQWKGADSLKLLAHAVEEGLDYEPTYVYDRQAVRQKRDRHEIGFSAVRGGNIVGEHDVLFVGHDEIVTLSHSARSKEVFAVGAVNAALFMVGKPAGLYTMADLVK